MSLCKHAGSAGPRRPAGWLLGLLLAAWLPACTGGPSAVTVTLEDLEAAVPVAITDTRRVYVSDPAVLHDLCTPLGSRLGLLQIHRTADWERLSAAAPELGPCPDLRSGSVIGLACWAGTPVSGHWPIRIDAVHLHRGAGLLEARFVGGTYLPDGAAVLETAHVRGLHTLLVANINGSLFCPAQEQDERGRIPATRRFGPATLPPGAAGTEAAP